MLVRNEGIWRSWGRFRRLYEWDFEGGMSVASTWAGFATTWLKSWTSAVAISFSPIWWSPQQVDPSHQGLWKQLSSVLGRNERFEENSSPSFKPDAYLDFIERKVRMVYDETSGAPQPAFRNTTHSFSDLQLCSMEDLEAIIKSSPTKSCDLDPIPTFLLKEFLDQLLPFILLMCNKSLSTGTLPPSQKRAIVMPRLKKKGMDLSDPGSFRPISNLSFLSKILEKIVVGQLMPYLVESDLLPKFQSGYRSHHSTETLLARLLSDLHTSIDNGEVTILALLDVSAAFDSVDHNILIRRLRASFGINSRALDWLESFVRGRTQSVRIGSLRSEWRVIGTGVPQGSVLGPLLYVLFTADVLEVAGRAGAGVQQYADDTQAYRHCKASEAMHALIELVNTIAEIKDWMSSNRLKLNPSKTQYIWIGNKIQLAKIDRQALLQRFPGIVFETSVIDLGVVIDEELKMDAHVGRITRSCFYQLRQIRTICQSLSDSAIRTLIHSFVVTRIDYCNSVLSGITAVQTERVQRILNAAARLVLRIPKFAPVSMLIRDNLHWLPAVQRIKFKILQLVANCIHQRAPLYLQELCVLVSAVPGRRQLWSADQFCLVVNRCRLSSMQRRGFALAGPLAWNDLPVAVRVSIARNRNSYRTLIKTHLFNLAIKWRSGTVLEQSTRAPEKTLEGALTK